MDVIQHIIQLRKIKCCLVFFCIISFSGCTKKTAIQHVMLVYEDGKAVAVSFGSSEPVEGYDVYVHGTVETPVLGEFKVTERAIIFTPAIPFTKGQGYDIKKNNKTVINFEVLADERNEPPKVLAMYPSADTIPENLLKIYLVFSKPMQEVQSALDFIEVFNVTDAQETSIFLPLANELWNAEHTELTLWLDPGRIKTDLIPNRIQGLPIRAGNTYRITISEQWKAADGTTLAQAYTKSYTVDARDRQQPNPELWELTLPKSGTQDALLIDFQEPLDAMLALETIQLMHSDKAVVQGQFRLINEEHVLAFDPDTIWQEGRYSLVVDSKLEDLAGNNLNHLFDKDLESPKERLPTDVVRRNFEIN